MNRYNIRLNDKTYDVLVRECHDNRAMLDINGKRYVIDRAAAVNATLEMGMANFPRVNALAAEAVPAVAEDPGSKGQAVKETVMSPLPGSVLEIIRKAGDTVQAGDVVIKLEAMKMETEIQASESGTVQSVHVKVGDSVQQNQALVDIG